MEEIGGSAKPVLPHCPRNLRKEISNETSPQGMFDQEWYKSVHSRRNWRTRVR